MSIRFDSTTDRLASNGNMPSKTAHTFFMWCKFISTTAAVRTLMNYYNNASGKHWSIERDASANFRFRADGSTYTTFASAPTFTTWFATYFIVDGATVTCGWRQEGGGAWVSDTGTASDAFTELATSGFRIGANGESPDMETRYMRQWNSVKTEADMTAEFQSTTIVAASPLRNLPMAAGASAGDDISANNYDMTATSITDGASEPAISSGIVIPVFMNQYRQRRA